MDLDPPIRREGQRSTYTSFTFDDIPRLQWRTQIQKFNSWLKLQMARPRPNLKRVLYSFTLKFTGTLVEWYNALKKYCQLEFIHSESTTNAISWLHYQFLGLETNMYGEARFE